MKKFAILFAVLFVVALSGAAFAATVTINPSKLDLVLNATGELTATPSVGGHTTVTWSVVSSDIASIDANANKVTVKALKVGKTTIRAVAGSVSADCVVTVTQKLPDPISKDIPVKKPVEPIAVEGYTYNVNVFAVVSEDNLAALFGRSTGVIQLMPQVTTTAPVDAVAEMKYVYSGDVFAGVAGKASDVKFAKQKKGETAFTKFTIATSKAPGNGEFIVLDDTNAISTASFDVTKRYTLVVGIRNGGEYDTGTDALTVTDPGIMYYVKDDGKKSSGGCDAVGFGALALLALVPFVFRRK